MSNPHHVRSQSNTTTASIISSTPKTQAQNSKDERSSARQSNVARTGSPQKQRESMGLKERIDATEMRDYKLGDCLGKGAFGAVYRALNWSTGETVAVKQIRLSDLAKTELQTIMVEIDLLKTLNHPNIVKYHGFVKSQEALNIILEYCENGSLHSICKSFGKFPENLVGVYMSQVLNGLLYLHEQGVIHRDIKGANILTTKEGLVKLADFGVATNSPGLHESNVVGTPYWMAPEVIELVGATTASDIWSLGCTVIELLDGKPPYHQFQPLQALFRIVQEDHPPLPESISPSCRDFLMQCFQKDPNLRVSAKKLLRHPWIVSAKRADSVIPVKSTKYDEAVKSVQEWNEALKSPEATIRYKAPLPVASRNFEPSEHLQTPAPEANPRIGVHARSKTEPFRSPDLEESDNWDDDFASSISPSALQLPHLRPVDNFDGLLSTDRLKSFAVNESEIPAIPGMSPPKGHFKAMSLDTSSKLDSQQTVRANSPTKVRHGRQRSERIDLTKNQVDPPRTQILKPIPLQPSQVNKAPRPRALVRSSSMFKENEDEDYSDLVTDDEIALEQRLNEVMRSKQNELHASPRFSHVRDLTSRSKSMKSHALSNTASVPDFPDLHDFKVRRTQSSLEIQKYAERIEDEDFSDMFGSNGAGGLPKVDSESGSDTDMAAMLNSRFSTSSWNEEDEDEDDPFAKLEEELDQMDLKTKVARDKYVRLCASVESLIGLLKVPVEDEDDNNDVKVAREMDMNNLAETSGHLFAALYEMPELRDTVISAHGLLPILEVLDNCRRPDISLPLLKCINIIILDSIEFLENFCFVGGIPIVASFAHRKYQRSTRFEAAAFVRQMYQASTLIFQMFISCGGLQVLVDFLEEDYENDRDLVLIGVNGISSVFELQGSTPKSDFCRILSRASVLRPLSLLLSRALSEEGELAELVVSRIVSIFHLFSQAENLVKERVADRLVLITIFNNIRKMPIHHKITMLKFIKNLSMLATTLDSLSNSNTIESLTYLLQYNDQESNFKDISNQVVNILFNLCRLNKKRQEEAAIAGIIPILQKVVKSEWPLKEFALPILCDMAHAGKMARMLLWQNKGLQFYVGLLADPYWQVTALDAIYVWLQEETAKVESHLLRDELFSQAITACFNASKNDSFETLLEPLQKLLRLSPDIASTLENPDVFSRTAQRLHNKKAVVRGNLLRVIRIICEACEQRHHQTGLLQRHGLYNDIARLADHDPAILIRNMATELIKYNNASTHVAATARLRGHNPRRTSSSNATRTPPSLYASSSQPPTPQTSRTTYFDALIAAEAAAPHPRTSYSNMRPVSRDGPTPTAQNTPGDMGPPLQLPSSAAGSATGTPQLPSSRSKLPRTSAIRHARPSLAAVNTDSPTPSLAGGGRPSLAYQPRRRRQTSSGVEIANTGKSGTNGGRF